MNVNKEFNQELKECCSGLDDRVLHGTDGKSHLAKIKEVYDFISSVSIYKDVTEIISKYSDDPDVMIWSEASGELKISIVDVEGGYSSELRATTVNSMDHWRVEPIVIDIELGAEHLAITASNYLDGYVIDGLEWDDIILNLCNAFTQGGFSYHVCAGRHKFNRNILDVWAADGDEAYSAVSFAIEECEGEKVLRSMKIIKYLSPDGELFYLHPLEDVKRGYA